MKTAQYCWIIGALLAITMVFYWWLRPVSLSQGSQTTPPVTMDQNRPENRPPTFPDTLTADTPVKNVPDTNQQKAFLTAFLKPISFWGKVTDQQGVPISGAKVDWSASNNPNPSGSGSKGHAETDASGMFSVSSFGIGLFVKVSKEGYDPIPTGIGGQRGSMGRFKNAGKLGNTDSPMGTRSDPSIFLLRKKGEAAELIYISDRSVLIPKNGAPVDIALDTGDAVPMGKGDLRVECWTEDEKKDAEGQYPWRCRLSVPGGGLLKRENNFDFQAPLEGYQTEEEVLPSQSRWLNSAERQYFIKMADGHFARINIRIRTGGAHFIVIQSYFNINLGDRNLEYDEAKEIKK